MAVNRGSIGWHTIHPTSRTPGQPKGRAVTTRLGLAVRLAVGASIAASDRHTTGRWLVAGLADGGLWFDQDVRVVLW
jgi:hypothetical protein